jgi:hypothetical protein
MHEVHNSYSWYFCKRQTSLWLCLLYPEASHDLCLGCPELLAVPSIMTWGVSWTSVGVNTNPGVTRSRHEFGRLMQVHMHASGFGSDSASMAWWLLKGDKDGRSIHPRREQVDYWDFTSAACMSWKIERDYTYACKARLAFGKHIYMYMWFLSLHVR